MSSPLTKIRWLLGFFIVGLVLSGVTAFPLVTELRILCHWFAVPDSLFSARAAAPADADLLPLHCGMPRGLVAWLIDVRDGLEQTHTHYPFLFYGTDWLAFAHIVIAVFFIGPWRDPVRNRWVLQAGLIACAGVLPLALICGPIRGIPFYWRLIDCSFGIIGCIPLFLALRLTDRLQRETQGRVAIDRN